MEVSPHSLFLLQQLNVQREFGFLCDCTVAIGNVYFKAHRAVLAAFSNYFKMIFIHQSSECIKIQPSDIQPDIFSYLLHIMYTGMGPKQPVDPGRLQEGIRFLHAYQLCRTGGEASTDVSQGDTDAGKVSNLYGIQISSQCASKEEDPRSRSQEERLVRGVEPESCETLVRVKQEKMQTQVTAVVATPPGSPGLYCHLCGERAESRQVLRQHLLSHVAASLPFSVPASVLETEPAEQRPLPEEEPAGGARKRKISCVICSRRFAHKRHLQEHMYTHTGKQAHLQRYSHLCSQLIQASQHCCQSPTNTQDNLSSCYSLDSDVSQESIDAVVVE